MSVRKRSPHFAASSSANDLSRRIATAALDDPAPAALLGSSPAVAVGSGLAPMILDDGRRPGERDREGCLNRRRRPTFVSRLRPSPREGRRLGGEMVDAVLFRTAM